MKLFVTAISLLAATAAHAQNMPGMNMEPAPAPAPIAQTVASPAAPDLLHNVTMRKPIALAQFLDWARARNPTLAEADAAVRRNRQLARQAGLYPNPSVGYSGEQIRGGAYGGGEQGAFVQQQIVLGGKLGLRRDIYNQQAQAAQSGEDAQQTRVAASVQQAFYQALAAQQTVVLRQKLMHVAEDAAATAKQLANVGQADAPDVLQAEVEGEQAAVEFTTAQHSFLAAFAQLAALANQPELPASPLASSPGSSLETPPALDPNQQATQAIANSPVLAQAQREVAVAEARIRDAKREAVPDVTVQAGEQWSGEQTGTTLAPAGPMSFASASVNLPLWNRNQGNVQAAQAELARAQAAVTRTTLALHAQTGPLAEQYSAARYTAERYRAELIPRAQQAYELYRTKYAQMASAYPQVLVSQRTLFQLQLAYLQALANEWSAAIALQNYGLSGGLAMPEQQEGTATSVNLPNGE